MTIICDEGHSADIEQVSQQTEIKIYLSNRQEIYLLVDS